MDANPSTALTRFGVDELVVTRALGDLLGRDIDDADLYFEHIDSESISLEEGMVKKAGRSVRQGVGVRAVSGERTGYAHSDAVDPTGLLEATGAAKAIARTASQDISVDLSRQSAGHDLYPVREGEVPAIDVPLNAKLDLLKAIDGKRIERFIHWSTCGVFGKPYTARDGEKVNIPFNEESSSLGDRGVSVYRFRGLGHNGRCAEAPSQCFVHCD